ncbi:MAG: PQQ-binding-like beta-propeller repeat protein [Planctomycetes bacterium]|nr:PQQ-binding-like beta-propeller repeat protein [Planctomycetota bacterium]
MGRIYAGAGGGVGTVLEAGDEFKILGMNKIGERIMATPALVDGVVYVRTEKSLYAFGKQ